MAEGKKRKRDCADCCWSQDHLIQGLMCCYHPGKAVQIMERMEMPCNKYDPRDIETWLDDNEKGMPRTWEKKDGDRG